MSSPYQIYELDPAHFLSAPELAWQTCLNKTRVKLELLTDIDMLLTVEKGIRGGTCHSRHRYAKANNKYMSNYDKDMESSYLEYFRCEQFVWMGNVSKTSVKWFQMGRRAISI